MNGRSTSTTVSGSGNRANLTGSLDLSKAVFTSLGPGGGDGTRVYRYFIVNDTPQTISGDVSVTGYMADYSTNVQSDTGYPLGDVADYTYNLNGSGRIIVEAGVISEKAIYSKSESEWATIIFEVNSGEITQTSHNVSGVSRSETRFAIKSIQIST